MQKPVLGQAPQSEGLAFCIPKNPAAPKWARSFFFSIGNAQWNRTLPIFSDPFEKFSLNGSLVF